MSLTQKRCLFILQKRYFRPDKGELLHFGDCAIYRVVPSIFCSCGLLHDLNVIDCPLVQAVYPRYFDDLHLQECQTECQIGILSFYVDSTLKEIFGEIPIPTSLEIEEKFQRNRELILEVFGETFPNAIKRLKEKYKDDLMKCL